MATTKDFTEYVCDNVKEFGMVTSKKMFGEYMVYINYKPLLLVCDNTVYIKMLDEIKEFMINADTGYPYDGAKEHYILDVEDYEVTSKVIPVLERVISVPKRKTKK